MNSKKFLFGLCSVLALAGCSSDEEFVSTDGEMVSDGTPRYMSVNLVANSTGGTRDTKVSDPTFENGLPEENAIKKIRFYFFTDDGNIAAVKADGTNYFDCAPTSISSSTGNIEETLAATIVINTKQGDRIPSKMLAIINPDEAGLSSGNLSMSEVRGSYKDYAGLANAASPVFVMANSVYRDNSMERVSTSRISGENIKTDSLEALSNPVLVYVERNVAKVALQYGAEVKTNEQSRIILHDKNGKEISISKSDGTESVPVYLKVFGWDLTANTTQAYLSKHINTGWADNLLSANEPWTSNDYHRSYWASNMLTGAGGMTGEDISGIEYSSFNAHKTSGKQIAANGAALTLNNYKYTNENAGSDYSTGRQRSYPTQAIVVGQIVDGNDNPVTVSEYLGSQHYEADSTCENLRTTIASVLSSVYYFGDANSKTSIGKDDITLETVSVDASQDALDTQGKNTGRYKVKVKLSATGENKNWFTGGDKNSPTISVDDLNEKLAAYKANVWKNGLTYYAFKINHLASEDIGLYGVVRNHYYMATIEDIIGLGTPVYDQTKKIYPEEPVDEDSYIAAKINILAWRVVPKTVTLGK